MKRKFAKPPKCRGCNQYDRFRNCCKLDHAVRVLNGVPDGPCPNMPADRSVVTKSAE